ncbi:MAG TPA: HAMP domain-containing sensor histidine kinase [Longimicrobiales bacterium]|nr:HAMP domain-containing sensor histidine kinase [Longimicrobiales bacterium]
MSEPAERLDARRRELLGTLAHELRSPIGAILGFEELLSEGLYGNMDPRALDVLARVGNAARQLLQLVDGMSDLGAERHDGLPHETAIVHPAALLEACLAAVRPEAESRATQLELRASRTLAPFHTDPARAARAIQLALGAAVKVTHGGHIRVAARGREGALTLGIDGADLSPAKDDPDRAPSMSGAGLRIAMARRALQPLDGTVELLTEADACSLRLRLPPLPPLTPAPD